MASPKVRKPGGASGGDLLEILSGGVIRVKSGGTVLLDSGGILSLDGATLTGTPITGSGVGAKNGSTVTAVEYGSGLIHKTELTLLDTPITMRDTEQGGGVKVYDFPAGRILFLGAIGTIIPTTHSVILDTLNGGKTCNWGVGSTTQASATLATTEQDIIQVTAWTSGTVIDVAAAASNGIGVLAVLDGTSSAVDAFLNLAVAGSGDIDANAAILISGTITITWLNLGDY
jgi:hypothetical protein